MTLKGTAVSPGYALGKAFLYRPTQARGQTHADVRPPAERKDAFDAALRAAALEFDALIARLESTGNGQGAIFLAQKEILLDEDLLEKIEAAILGGRKTPDAAVCDVYDEFIALLSAAKDPLFAARAADLEDVRSRLLRILAGHGPNALSMLEAPVIVVAEDLLPSDTVTLRREMVLGIVTARGSAASHTAILANSYGIPAVVGVDNAMEQIAQGQQIALDAIEGLVEVGPNTEQKEQTVQKMERFAAKQRGAQRPLSAPCATADGRQVQIGLNIGAPQEAAAIDGADFIGLFRTEFLYMQSSHAPTEEEQFLAYKTVVERAHGKPVTLRTLDIGGDKTLPYLPPLQQQNPALGKRALRLCFDDPRLFRTQLRAALRASAFGPLWVMLPMVGSIDDIRRARAYFEEQKAVLGRNGIPYGSDVRFGIMIEVPSIAVIAELAAKEVDFASVGTNDLCQYLCAADRTSPELTAYYQSFSPAMVRTLGTVADAFNTAGKPISVCGEIAGDTLGAALLVGLGITRLSMNSGRMAGVKTMLATQTKMQLCQLAQQAKCTPTQQEVVELVRRRLAR